MNVASKLEITIDTPAVGKIYFEVPYSKNNEFEKNPDDVVVSIPRGKFVYTDYTHLDLSFIIESDIKKFKALNSHSDENHQVYTDSLTLYGIIISGNYIRLQYWFHQDNDPESHRMCAGNLTRCHDDMKVIYKGEPIKLFPEGYSSDVAVYW